MRSNLKKIVVLIALFAIGCDGPIGPAGDDVEGIDITPPTVFLSDPTPYLTVWDSFPVKVLAIDNVAVRAVSVYIDGLVTVGDNDQSLLLYESPFDFEVSNLTRGWHFVSARAVDVAGNVADSPVVPIWFGYADELQDTTVTLRYHSQDIDSIWTIPNESRAFSYWAKFNTAKECTLKSVSFMVGGTFSDTSDSELKVSILKGTDVPREGTRDSSRSFSGVDISGDVGLVGIDFSDYGGIPFSGISDFFVVVSLINPEIGDTLWIGSDDGEPAWNRSGSRDDLGWYYLDNKYSVKNNFLIDCNLYYGTSTDEEE